MHKLDHIKDQGYTYRFGYEYSHWAYTTSTSELSVTARLDTKLSKVHGAD